MGLFSKKLSGPPAYGSAWWRPAVPGDHPFGKNLSIALSLLEAVIQLPVTDDDAHAAGFGIGGVYGRKSIDHAGEPDSIVGPPQILADN